MKYLLGNEKIFFDFIDSIKKDDKVAIISHNDVDGVAAPVFLERILSSREIKIDLIYFLTYGEDMFDKPIDEMKNKKISKVFVIDIQADLSATKGFERLRMEFDVFWIDHHPVKEFTDKKQTIKTETPDCASLILFNLSKNYFDVKDLNWLVCAAMAADWSFRNPGNMAYIKKFYNNFDENNLETSEVGKIVVTINDSLIYYVKNINKVFEALKKGNLKSLEKTAKEVGKELKKVTDNFFEKAEFYSEKDLYFLYKTTKFHLMSAVSSIVSMKKQDKIIVFASDIENGKVKVSARNQSGRVNLGEILNKSVQGLENSNGGGHIYAASASFMKKDLKKFKENLLKNIN